jgi:hypothetical protein
MSRSSTLVLSGADHRRLADHLFPGDGKEAAALLVCTRVQRDDIKLLARETILVPHADCVREADRITWPAAILDEWQERTEVEGLSLVLVHSHPNGFFGFSGQDDRADRDVMPYLYPFGRADAGADALWHGSAVMMPGGDLLARLYDRSHRAQAVDLVAVYGDELKFYWPDQQPSRGRPMAFTGAMRDELARLSVVVIGISGTGSIVAEQLLRMGVGEIIVIDHDHVEHKNINRILNTTQRDAFEGRLKVDVFRSAAAAIRPATRVLTCAQELGTAEAIELAARADIVFSCVDTYNGRHIADRLAVSMLQPLFDVGVVIPVRKPARGVVISNVCGRIDYVQPGGSTLLDRGVYTPALLRAESLRREDPEAFEGQVEEGYMPGTQEQAPSVITVNMRAASAVVQEFLARAYPYRLEANRHFARTEFDLATEEHSAMSEDQFPSSRQAHYASGMSAPLLGLPVLEGLRCAS